MREFLIQFHTMSLDREPRRTYQVIKAERKRQIAEENGKKRRRLIVGGVSAFFLTVAGGGAIIFSGRDNSSGDYGDPSADVMPSPQIIAQSYNDLNFVYPDRREDADLKYLDELIGKLREEKGTKQERIKAIEDNIVTLSTPGLGMGTALKVDTSGIFVTAGHMFGSYGGGAMQAEQGLSYMVDYKTRIARPIHWYIIDPFQDIALFYSPTGERKSPTPHLQIALDIPVIGETVVAYGTHLLNDSKGAPSQVERSAYKGVVAASLREYDEPPYTESFVMKNAMTVPGDSGGPVRDIEGRMRGVVSSKVPYPDTSTYQIGGAAGSIKGLGTLLDNARKNGVKNLPVRK